MTGLKPNDSILLMLLQLDQAIQRFGNLKRQTIHDRLLRYVRILEVPRLKVFFVLIGEQVFLSVLCPNHLISRTNGSCFFRSNRLFDRIIYFDRTAVEDKVILTSFDCMLCLRNEISSQRSTELASLTPGYPGTAGRTRRRMRLQFLAPTGPKFENALATCSSGSIVCVKCADSLHAPTVTNLDGIH